nr:mechanosensitive ion channel domain-containing protein [Ancylomarina longa]
MIDYLPNLFSILIIVIIFRYLFKLIKTLAREIENGTLKISAFNPLWAKTTAKIINFILLAFLLIMIIPLMPGYESLAFKGVATFLAALITIGGSSVIANFMAGIVTSYMNPCKVGDVLNAQLQW